MNNDSRPTFRFQNLGPIKEAEMELGDLTIIAGRNNTGKTYVAYALYGFLKQWHFYTRYDIDSRRNPLYRLAEEARETGMLKLPIDQESLKKHRTEILYRTALEYSLYYLPALFSADAETFSASFDVLLDDSSDIDIEQFEDMWTSLNQEGDEWIVSPKGAHSPESDHYYSLVALYTRVMFPELLVAPPDPFILTSERFGISLFYRELDLRKNELVRKLQQIVTDHEKGTGSRSPYELITEESSRYALPIHHNINFTRDIPNRADRKSELYEQKRYDDIKRMMQGYYRVENGGVRFVSTARKEKRFNIPLYRASSSARGLSDLYFYMRHVAQKGQLLMVDEPEAHLDTANQIEMARLLARLARSGVKVLVTTHSDYIVKEFNNLIMLSQPFQNKKAVIKRLKYGEDEYLDADQVRAYIADDGKLRRCETNPYGIKYPNFDKTIDDINNVANELSERVWEEQEE